MDKQEVAIVEIRIPFLSLLTLFLKIAVAAVPALIVFIVLASYISFAINNLPRP
jgi:ABC-type multidrug transport system permease subunit